MVCCLSMKFPNLIVSMKISLKYLMVSLADTREYVEPKQTAEFGINGRLKAFGLEICDFATRC